MLTKEDLLQIRKLMQEEIQPFKKEVKSEFKKVRKDIRLAVRFFDTEFSSLRTRVDRIEDHLDLPPLKN